MSYYTGIDEDARLEQDDDYRPSPEEIAEHEADDREDDYERGEVR